jgi:8-oxo-dGTP diphosphatase
MTDFPSVLVTVDVAMFSLTPEGSLRVLLPRRPHEPFAGVPALPGAYVQTDDHDAAGAARRALIAKAGIDPPYLEQLATFSGPARDPRGWSVSIAYYALVRWSVVGAAAGDTYDVSKLMPLPFDHAAIVATALERLRSKSSYSMLPLHLVDETFTIADLHDVYQFVIGEAITRTAFRSWMLDNGAIEPTGTFKPGQHRPAALYRAAKGAKAVAFPTLFTRRSARS